MEVPLSRINLPATLVVPIPAAAKLSGVSRRTIYNWLAEGKLHFVRNAGGAVRIDVRSLWRQDDGQHLAVGAHLPVQMTVMADGRIAVGEESDQEAGVR